MVQKRCGYKSVAFVKGLVKSGLLTGEKLLTHVDEKSFPKECKQFLETLA